MLMNENHKRLNKFETLVLFLLALVILFIFIYIMCIVVYNNDIINHNNDYFYDYLSIY